MLILSLQGDNKKIKGKLTDEMKENEVLIKVDHLSKKFCKNLKMSLWYGVKDLYSNIRGRAQGDTLRPEEFWSVKNISFEVRRGECLGLIGHNGAGKSTLLKILNGLINPDEGKITIKGKVGALIELGAGFNSILTGRENIYNNGAILGFSKKEIDDKIEEIIDFSEIREFIDMPVQNYSSGMKVRLGFAVAAQMEPDVLIIDEVLAVGDLGFVLKCFKTIDTILPKTAIVFVSHSMPMISRICSEVLLMEHGVSKFQGKDVGKAIDLYYQRFVKNEKKTIFSDDRIELIEAKLIDLELKKEIKEIHWGQDLVLYFKFKLIKKLDDFLMRVIFNDKEQRAIAIIEKKIITQRSSKNNDIEFYLKHESLQMSKGIYSIDISLFININEPIYRVNGVLAYSVIHVDEVWPPFLLDAKCDYK